MPPLAYALLGFAAVALGARIAIRAPGDGQTGMCCFPLGCLGAVLFGCAIASVLRSSSPHYGWTAIVMLGFAAAVLVGWSIVRSNRYSKAARGSNEPDD